MEYAYTTGALGSVEESYTYTYGNSNWKDLLTNYNGANITYDAIGNPLSDGTWTYTWQEGRKLASMTRGSTTYNYIYHSDQLTHMTYGSNVLHFYYDASGRPLSVVYNNLTYYYVLNLQGDVVALLDSSGNQVVGYRYDAWGRLLATTGSKASTLGLNNPLRYRGYVYDRETGLYYLESRYYNSEIGRFINADNQIAGIGGEVSGYNLFAYCMNNPVNMSDPTGNWSEGFENAFKVVSVLIAVTAVVVTVATVSAFTAGTGSAAALYVSTVVLGAALSGINGGVANEAKGNSYFNGYWGGATGGAIQGAFSKTPIGTMLGGGAGVAVGTVVTDALNNLDPYSANSTVQDMVENSLTSGSKALATSSLTAYMGYASKLAVANSAYGLMPTYTFGFGEAVKAFFGWLDDAMVYIWE